MRTSSGIASGETPSARAPQRQRGRDRVARLQEAAADLFVERGYEATTMTEIAARAGASIGSLYLFFSTKAALAQAMMAGLADELSAALDRLQPECVGASAGAIADALFGALSAFLALHPVYSVLVELPGDDAWKRTVRSRRRSQIAALFAGAVPELPEGQAERLAAIVPHLMRITMLSGHDGPPRDAVLEELRAMLRHHLEWPR